MVALIAPMIFLYSVQIWWSLVQLTPEITTLVVVPLGKIRQRHTPVSHQLNISECTGPIYTKFVDLGDIMGEDEKFDIRFMVTQGTSNQLVMRGKA